MMYTLKHRDIDFLFILTQIDSNSFFYITNNGITSFYDVYDDSIHTIKDVYNTILNELSNGSNDVIELMTGSFRMLFNYSDVERLDRLNSILKLLERDKLNDINIIFDDTYIDSIC